MGQKKNLNRGYQPGTKIDGPVSAKIQIPRIISLKYAKLSSKRPNMVLIHPMNMGKGHWAKIEGAFGCWKPDSHEFSVTFEFGVQELPRRLK